MDSPPIDSLGSPEPFGVPSGAADSVTAQFFANTDSPSLEEYRHRLDTAFGLDEMQHTYKYLSDKLVSDFERTAYWQEFTSSLISLEERHVQDHALHLLAAPGGSGPQVVAKPFDSVVEKSYRRNYLHNSVFPEPPDGLWIDQTNWYTRLRDIIRTTVVVKYLDGVRAVSKLVDAACTAGAVMTDVSMEARDEGYYAIHNVICVSLPMPSDIPWEVVSVRIPVEIQVATQMQDVIRMLTHSLYVDRRMRLPDPEGKWQWDWNSPEFVPNYLGHILHYVDGAIMDVRNKRPARPGD